MSNNRNRFCKTEQYKLEKGATQPYDLIFDAVAKRSFSECQRALSAQGIYVTTEISPALALRGQWISITGSQKMVLIPPKGPNKEIEGLFEEPLKARKLTPVIDRCFPLSEVPEAFRYYAKGHTQGRVVMTIVKRINLE